MATATLGLCHPGQMGATVGAAARCAGARVLFASEGRSPATRERARAAELEDVASLEALAAASEVLFAMCPPHAALALARELAGHGFRGLYVDANAVSPGTAREIGRVVEASGARFVDGGVIGPPVRKPGTTRLYLSGSQAPGVAALFQDGPLEVLPIQGGPGAASALKMCFASWTKGTSALLAAIRALALHEGVEADLLAEWARSLPDLAARSEGAARVTAPKAWRFVGEMHEIAASFAAAGLPDGFHRAAAEVYERLESFKDSADAPTLAEVTDTLLHRRS
jgi:3-hydroxyisobutyrate dehydrogenase-like beta-hydroxyacid dehydrogenase